MVIYCFLVFDLLTHDLWGALFDQQFQLADNNRLASIECKPLHILGCLLMELSQRIGCVSFFMF